MLTKMEQTSHKLIDGAQTANRPRSTISNTTLQFEKIGHESEQPHAPKPIRSITPPRRGAYQVEIENEPQQRATEVVSAFEKNEDTLQQKGFIRHCKEQFSSPHNDNLAATMLQIV